jgi:hypothetical protein
MLVKKWFLVFSFAPYSAGGYTVGLISRPSMVSTVLRQETTSANPTSPITMTSISLDAISTPFATEPKIKAARTRFAIGCRACWMTSRIPVVLVRMPLSSEKIGLAEFAW